MKFCPVVPEIRRGQVHGPRKERRKRRIIIIRNGAKTSFNCCVFLQGIDVQILGPRVGQNRLWRVTK
jgi:hypothetical protein